MSNFFTFDMEKVSEGVGLPLETTRKLFTNGRFFAFIAEEKFKNLPGFLPPLSSDHDVIDDIGRKVEVRSLTTNAIFRPSNQIGAGRKFSEVGFLEKLSMIDGYYFIDVNLDDIKNGKVFYHYIPKDMVKSWYDAGKLGKNAQLGRNTFVKVMKEHKMYSKGECP